MQDALELGTCQKAFARCIIKPEAGCILKRPADKGVDGDLKVTGQDRVATEKPRRARSGLAPRVRLRLREEGRHRRSI